MIANYCSGRTPVLENDDLLGRYVGGPEQRQGYAVKQTKP